MGRKLVLSLLSVAAMTASASAHAEPKVAIDWARLMVGLDAYVRTGAEKPVVAPAASATDERAPQSSAQAALQAPGNPMFGVAPSVTLVARDWGTAYRLAGDRLSLVDAMRLSESTRMIMSRVRLADVHVSRFTPFAQLGFGEWRTDTNIMPIYKRSTQIAAHVGTGFEMQMASTWQVACEVGATMFIRDTREVEDLPATRLWSATIASRMQF